VKFEHVPFGIRAAKKADWEDYSARQSKPNYQSLE